MSFRYHCNRKRFAHLTESQGQQPPPPSPFRPAILAAPSSVYHLDNKRSLGLLTLSWRSSTALSLRSRRRGEALLEVGNDVGNVLDTDGNSQEVSSNAGCNTLLVRKLLMSGATVALVFAR
jgi:hypothetical protein